MSEVLSAALLTGMTVAIFSAFGVVVLTALSEASDAPPVAAFAVGDADDVARAVEVHVVSGSPFRLADVALALAVNDSGNVADSWSRWGGDHLQVVSPGDILRVNVSASAPPMGAGTRFHLLVTHVESGRLVGMARATLPDPGAGVAADGAVILGGRPAVVDAIAYPSTVTADGQRTTIVTAVARHEGGLGLVRTVTVDFTPVGGASAVLLRDDGEGVDAVAGDGVFTAEVAPPLRADGSSTQTFELPVRAFDVYHRPSATVLYLTLQASTSTNAPPTASFTATTSSTGVDVDASASSDSDGSVVSYSWSWGDGTWTNLTGATESHTYAATGIYSVILTVHDDDGATAMVKRRVVVSTTNTPPLASVARAPTNGPAPLDVTFTLGASDADGVIANWTLQHGDGTSETGVGAPPGTLGHTYTARGSYAVNFSVTDDDGASVRVTTSVAVTDPPAATVTPSPAAGSTPLLVSFALAASDPDGVIANWTLAFGDGASTSGSGPPPATREHTYVSGGSFTARFGVTDDMGVSRTATATVQVNARPTASVVPTPASGPAPLAVTLALSAADADGTIANWTLDLGDGVTDAGSGAPPASRGHTYAASGTYVVKLGVTDDRGASRTATATVGVSARPTASVTPTPASGTAPLAVSFALTASDPDGTIANWTLQHGDGTDATGFGMPPSPVGKTYTAPGTYAVNFSVTDDAGVSVRVTTTVVVNAPPTAGISPSPSSGGAPLPVTFTLTASDPDGTIANWTLQHGDGTSVAGSGAPPASRAKTYPFPGFYQANFSVTDDRGASVRVTTTVAVSTANTPPVARFTWSNKSLTLSVDGSTSSDADGSIVTYTWSWGDGSPDTVGVTASKTYASAGVRTVTLTVRDNQGATHSVSRSLQVDGKTWFLCPPSVTNHGTVASCSALRNDTDLGATTSFTESATGTNQAHRLEVEYAGDGLSAENAFTHVLQVRAAQAANPEALLVQVWDGSAWRTRITVTSSVMQTYAYTLTGAEWANGAPRVRLVDDNTGGTDKGANTQSSWNVDWMRVVNS